MFTAMREITYK